MARKEYAFYPGCSSQKGASASNYLTFRSNVHVQDKLDVKITEIPDWNCCGASDRLRRGRRAAAPGAERRATSPWPRRNMPGKEMVATCAACWLASARSPRSASTTATSSWLKDTNDRAQAEAGLQIPGHPPRSATWSRC
jgi:heterodisulfide reductase subunit B